MGLYLAILVAAAAVASCAFNKSRLTSGQAAAVKAAAHTSDLVVVGVPTGEREGFAHPSPRTYSSVDAIRILRGAEPGLIRVRQPGFAAIPTSLRGHDPILTSSMSYILFLADNGDGSWSVVRGGIYALEGGRAKRTTRKSSLPLRAKVDVLEHVITS